MRIASIKVAVVSALLTLAISGVAWAHVTVNPEEVPAGEFETLTVKVPTEKEMPTTEVRVEVPEGFTVSAVQPVPGWTHEFEREGGEVTAVVWSGGEIGPEEFQQFPISARTPEEPGEYAWRAFQTYEDGSVVEWTGPPEAETPASVMNVVSGGAQAGGHGGGTGGVEQAAASSETAASADTLPETGGTSAAVYLAAGTFVLLLGLALMAIFRRTEN